MTRLTAEYATKEAFVVAVDQEVAHGGVLIRGAQPGTNPECVVEFRVAGEIVGEVSGRIGSTGRFGVTVTFDEPPDDLLFLADTWRDAAPAPDPEPPAPEPEPEPVPEPEPEPEHKGTMADRLAKMSVAQKIAFALAADREGRLALFRDNNKTLHAYVLRNPRVQLDEVIFAAKLPGLSPDALKAIAEHKDFGANQTVQIAVLKNPKSPMPVALKILPHLPERELRMIAKGGARDQLVAAARKIISG